jgi:fluoride exporter
MMDVLYVGFGGALGSLARYQIGRQIGSRSRSTFPVSTLLINITGAILLGLVTGYGLQGRAYLLAAEGFLGAYTTFSTFMYEGFNLYKGDEKKNARVYIIGTMITGMAGYLAGWILGNWILGERI